MERGELGIENRTATCFVFEGLIGQLQRKRAESLALRLHQWETALSAWSMDITVCDYMVQLMGRDVPIDVITWRPKGFADVLLDELWNFDIPVRGIRRGTYQGLSQHIAIDTEVSAVFDPDPAHRNGYGWKCREFNKGQW
jgi:hypothetical protein